MEIPINFHPNRVNPFHYLQIMLDTAVGIEDKSWWSIHWLPHLLTSPRERSMAADERRMERETRSGHSETKTLAASANDW